MSELGVEVSLAKSHVSETTLEFAKRLFHQVQKSPHSLFRQFMKLLEAESRGWALPSLENSIAMSAK